MGRVVEVGLAAVAVVIAAIAWAVARTAGLIRFTVGAVIAGVWMVSAWPLVGDSGVGIYAYLASLALALTQASNFADKRYERWRSRPAPTQ